MGLKFEQFIARQSWLYKYPSKRIGFPFLFVYWDRLGEVLEFDIFGKVSYFWVSGVE